MKNLLVDKETCLGCGTCVAVAEKTFKMGIDGKAELILPLGDEEAKVQEAIDSCPVQAINWKESN